MNRSFFRSLALVAAVVAAPLSAAWSDSITIKGIEYADVRITGVKGQEIYYSINNNEVHKPLADVTKVRVDGEAAFNAAEDAYATRSYDKAVDGYQKTVQGTNKPWLKDWAATRLAEAANKAGRFDAAVRAYIALAEKDPEAARVITLTMPKSDSAYLAGAVAPLKQAIDASEKKPATQELLMRLLADVYKAKGDAKGEEEITTLLVKKEAERDPNSPAALRAKVTLMLTQARKALDAKDYDRVIEGIRAEAGNIVEPDEQADALWYIAEAKRGKAAGSKDAEAWKDVAVAYMRLVSNFKLADPHVSDALLRVADIYATQLNDPDAAKAILKRMIDEDYKGQEPAKVAQKQLETLK